VTAIVVAPFEGVVVGLDGVSKVYKRSRKKTFFFEKTNTAFGWDFGTRMNTDF
jgi:hypothetical protein